MATTELSNYEKVLVRYEAARRLVRDLKAKRAKLILECDDIEDETCLTKTFKEWAKGLSPDGEHYRYQGYLSFCERKNKDGDMCDSCYEAIKIKRTSLAEAKREFGLAKKAVSYAGSKIIKMMETNHDN